MASDARRQAPHTSGVRTTPAAAAQVPLLDAGSPASLHRVPLDVSAQHNYCAGMPLRAKLANRTQFSMKDRMSQVSLMLVTGLRTPFSL